MSSRAATVSPRASSRCHSPQGDGSPAAAPRAAAAVPRDATAAQCAAAAAHLFKLYFLKIL